LNKPLEYEQLLAFYKAVANLTVDHDVLHSKNGDHAVVYPNKLSDELAKVDSNWYENAFK
jgi:hypothetical protein